MVGRPDGYHADVPSLPDSDAAPVDPPIPVPDVAGADASVRGLPRRVDLTLRQRLIVDSSAVADIALRTAIASLLSVTMMPALLGSALRRSESRAEADHLRFYAELGQAQDPALSFPAPTDVPRVSSRPANPVAEWMAKGRVHNIRFTSSFEAVNPALRDRCRGYVRNNVVHAQHWVHDDGPHPTLCVIHGFMGSPYLFNGLFFSLPWFYRSGYDVLLYTLPFHGQRAEKGSPFSGYGYFAHGFSGFAEAMAQAVHDFRSVIDYLEFTGVDRVALTGMSLGGYTSALLACVGRPNPGRYSKRPGGDTGQDRRRVVPRKPRGPNAQPHCRNRRRTDSRRDDVSVAAELSAVGAQGPATDHHRTRRSAGTT